MHVNNCNETLSGLLTAACRLTLCYSLISSHTSFSMARMVDWTSRTLRPNFRLLTVAWNLWGMYGLVSEMFCKLYLSSFMAKFLISSDSSSDFLNEFHVDEVTVCERTSICPRITGTNEEEKNTLWKCLNRCMKFNLNS